MHALLSCTDAELLGLAQTIYDIPSLAAWRAAESGNSAWPRSNVSRPVNVRPTRTRGLTGVS